MSVTREGTMNIFLETVAERLMRLDRKRPWLAVESGIGVSTLNNWFAYDRWPTLDCAAKIADSLDLSLDELAGRKVEPSAARLSGSARIAFEYLSSLSESEASDTVAMLKLARAIDLMATLPTRDYTQKLS